MSKLQTLIKNKQSRYKQNGITEVFKKEDGAIDLASIMVGVIVIGLIGGVIAATVFAVIPWTQDNAAKQQLDSIVQAENAYFGLSAASPSPLPAGYKTNSFGKSAELANAKLLVTGPRYCVTTPDDSKSYTGYSQSSSGTIWTITDKNSKPEPLVVQSGTKAVDSLPADCQFITEGMTDTSASTPIVTPTPTATPTPYVDPTPTIIKLTYRCDTTTNVFPPMNGALNGTLTWSDGSAPYKYSTSSGGMNFKSLTAGVTYTATFDGTFTAMSGGGSGANCLRSVDHWGVNTGTASARFAFKGATNLTSVPAHIPTTITDMTYMFQNTTNFNDPNVGQWDVSKVTNMSYMFSGATALNQPLNNWDVSKVTDMTFMFQDAASFNQPLNNWNTVSVGTMVYMFNRANAFNQDLSSWNTNNVKSMAFMFDLPHEMKNNVNYTTAPVTISFTYKCDTTASVSLPMNGALNGTLTWSDGSSPYKYSTSSGGMNFKSLTAGVTYTVTYEGTFTTMTGGSTSNPCLRSVDVWGPNTGTTSARMAFRGSNNLTSVPPSIPKTITDMTYMFQNNINLNDPNLGQWDVSDVTNMQYMFVGASNLNQSLNSWNVAKVTDMSYMFQDAASFNQPLNNWNTVSVAKTGFMFNRANAFNQDLSSWNTANTKNMAFMFGLPHDMKNNVAYTTAPVTISFTFKCDTSGSGFLPMNGTLSGTLSWNDGTVESYNYSGSMNSKPLTAGVTYTATYEGTFTSMTNGTTANPCLRSVDVWGANTGTTSARMAFRNATNLTNVPASIPTTITDMSYMFQNATNFNDSNIKNWNVSKVTNMSYMFNAATALNQDLKSSWNTGAVTNGTFFAPASFPDVYMPTNTSK